MNSIKNSLECGKRGTAGHRANRRIRIPMRFSLKFITASRSVAEKPGSESGHNALRPRIDCKWMTSCAQRLKRAESLGEQTWLWMVAGSHGANLGRHQRQVRDGGG